MHVAALVVLGFAGEGASSPGPMSLELLRATMGQRLHRVPRLRQVLSPPRRGSGAPVWADACMSEPGDVLLGRAELERAFTGVGERVARGGVVAMYSSSSALPWHWLTTPTASPATSMPGPTVAQTSQWLRG
jgi:hypothetical protein